MATKAKSAVAIGKFDILATYTYAKALRDGMTDAEAKERGMVAAIMGAKARSGHHSDDRAERAAAEKKKKSEITAESFDRQVSDKMGGFFGKTFLPGIERLVESGLSYDEVKRQVGIPPRWGAKIDGKQFEARTTPRVGHEGEP